MEATTLQVENLFIHPDNVELAALAATIVVEHESQSSPTTLTHLGNVIITASGEVSGATDGDDPRPSGSTNLGNTPLGGNSSGNEPPEIGGDPERGEGGRRIVGSCDFFDVYHERKEREAGRQLPDEYVNNFDKLNTALVEQFGARTDNVTLIIHELLNNYLGNVSHYIEAGLDNGKRLLVIYENISTQRLEIEYTDLEEVTSTTYNIFAKTFGQDLETVTEEEKAKLAAMPKPEHERDEGMNITELKKLFKDEGMTDEEIAATMAELSANSLFSADAKKGELGASGRGYAFISEHMVGGHIVRKGIGAHVWIDVKDTEPKSKS